MLSWQMIIPSFLKNTLQSPVAQSLGSKVARFVGGKYRSWLYLTLIIIFSALSTLIWLDYPRQVVFDEVHFGKYLSAYCCTKVRIFDVHPPHAKLLVAAVVHWFTQYRGTFDFPAIGTPYGDVPILWFRIIPALSGVVLPMIVFAILRLLFVHRYLAFLAGFLLVFDNALKTHSRIMAFDLIQIDFLLFALLGSLLAVRCHRRWHFYFWALTIGIACGFATGTKLSGLVGFSFAPVVFLWARQYTKSFVVGSEIIFVRSWREYLVWLTLSTVTGCGVFLVGWYLHFSILTLPGPSDSFYVLTNNFWIDVWRLNIRMIEESNKLTGTHPYASSWWSWPLMLRGIFYWSAEGRNIYLLGNPLIWWGSTMFAIGAIGLLLLTRSSLIVKERATKTTLAFLLVLYLLAWVPFSLLRRALFLYHYFLPFIFAVMMTSTVLDYEHHERLESPSRVFVFLNVLLLVSVVVVFIMMSPLTYGFFAPQYLEIFFSAFGWWR